VDGHVAIYALTLFTVMTVETGRETLDTLLPNEASTGYTEMVRPAALLLVTVSVR
jgi:hypothetical protein